MKAIRLRKCPSQNLPALEFLRGLLVPPDFLGAAVGIAG